MPSTPSRMWRIIGIGVGLKLLLHAVTTMSNASANQTGTSWEGQEGSQRWQLAVTRAQLHLGDGQADDTMLTCIAFEIREGKERTVRFNRRGLGNLLWGGS